MSGMLFIDAANSLVPHLKEFSTASSVDMSDAHLCTIFRLCDVICGGGASGTGMWRERTRPTEPLAVPPQEEHLNRILRSTLHVQSLYLELEGFPVPGTRIEQTESIWQLESRIDFQLQPLAQFANHVSLTAPIRLESALGSSCAKKPGT